jgi:rubredoxin
MWMLFHRNAKTKVVRDGHSFVETCPECGRKARFDEVEISESYGVFFIDLVDDKERKYRCSVCGDVFDLRDEPVRAPPAKSAKELAHERAVAEARQPEEAEQRRERAVAKANRIEDELAELKKRLGR